MKTKRTGDILVRIVTSLIGMFLRLFSIVIWVPARIGLGISDVLRDVGETLTNYTVVAPVKPVVEVIEANEETTE